MRSRDNGDRGICCFPFFGSGVWWWQIFAIRYGTISTVQSRHVAYLSRCWSVRRVVTTVMAHGPVESASSQWSWQPKGLQRKFRWTLILGWAFWKGFFDRNWPSGSSRISPEELVSCRAASKRLPFESWFCLDLNFKCFGINIGPLMNMFVYPTVSNHKVCYHNPTSKDQ